MKYTSGFMRQPQNGVYHLVQILKPEIVIATCTPNLEVSNNTEHFCLELLLYLISVITFELINIQGHDVKKLSGRWFKSNGPLKIADFDVNISE